MSSQQERLARPFPAKYVRAPAQGKFGDYVPHHVVTQALLAIVGPFDLDIGEIFIGAEGRIEGCLVRLTCDIDGRRVSVQEVGDCEQPGNWKTQGARMKDAISDGVKRCAARLGCGLHLYSGADYFLYEQLKGQDPLPASKNQMQRITAELTALASEGVDIWPKQSEWNLPSPATSDAKQLNLWEELIKDVRAELEAPFVQDTAGV